MTHRPAATADLAAAHLSRRDALALNAEGGAPDWIQLVPAGGLVVGRDGRRFLVADAHAVVAATVPHLPLVVDYEHDFETRAPGDDTPAAGWIEELAVREGSIWGRVEWAAPAAVRIANREYRFISPVLWHRRDTDPAEVVALASAGLTHRPNLDLKALNARAAPHTPETTMKDILIEALGLKAGASDAEIVAAVNALKDQHAKALNAAATPDPARYVPKAQADETAAALNAANARLAEIEAEAAREKAEQLVDGAIRDGRVAPAAREAYLALARNAFAETKAAIEAMPALVPAGSEKSAPPAGKGGSALTSEERAACAALGLAPEQFLAAKA